MKQLILFFSLSLFILPKSDRACDTCQNGRYLCASNMLNMNSRLCLDITEVPGHMYKDYLSSIARSQGAESDAFIKAKPDFKTWRNLFKSLTTDEIEKKFFESDDFALMPIVGISLEQAEVFCDWRTQKFKDELAEMSPKERAQFPKEFKFRLPTAREWSRSRFLTQEKRILKQISRIADDTKGAFRLSKSKILKKNDNISHIFNQRQPDLGFYNLLGNVSELTSEQGIAVGGSWFEPNEDGNFQAKYQYSKPEAWLGFRCVFEIID